MKKIKMTASIKELGLLAGKVYELPNKEAKMYLDADIAVEIKKEVKDGDR